MNSESLDSFQLPPGINDQSRKRKSQRAKAIWDVWQYDRRTLLQRQRLRSYLEAHR